MAIVLKENIPKVVTSAVFACVGTAGQRCTTLRRLIVHEDLYDEVNSGPYWHVPICPDNSPIHPPWRHFLSPKTSISQYIIARCWRSWRSLMPLLWADWEILLTMAHSMGPFTAKWLTTETQFYIFFDCFCVLTLKKVGVDSYLQTIADAKAAGGTIEFGGNIIERLL